MNESHGSDVISVLTHDHREVKDLFARIESAGDGATRRDLTDQMIAELVRHSVAEEMYLYPAVRDKVPGGDAMADRELKDHADVERDLKQLEALDGDDPTFMAVFRRVSDNVLAHVREEEQELFPALAASSDSGFLRELGKKVTRAKKLAPTRPHPSAPDTPPLNKLLAPGAGLVDRLRDKLSGRST